MTARRTMLANASFTAASAVFIFAARESLYPLFALESPALLAAIAAGLLLYAGSPDRRALLTAAVLDAGWVVGSGIVLIVAWTHLAPAGRLLLIAAALIVEVFATLQYRVARSIATEVGR